jgi:hypothetical protein
LILRIWHRDDGAPFGIPPWSAQSTPVNVYRSFLKKGGKTRMENKKVWAEPVLTEFGNIETLTLANNKTFGTGDSFTFQGQTTKLSG